jgi:hypothetical protein
MSADECMLPTNLISTYGNTLEPNQHVELIDTDRRSVTCQAGALRDQPNRGVWF